MRVAILGNYPSENFQSLVGGKRLPANTSHWNSNLAKALVRQGLDVHVVTLAPGLRQNLVVEDEGVIVHWLTLPQRARVATFFQWPHYIVQKTLHAIQPSIVHGVATEHEYAYLAQTSGYPCLIGVHILVHDILAGSGHTWPRRLRFAVFRSLEKRVLKNAPFITVTTPFLADAISISRRQRLFIIPNAVRPLYEQTQLLPRADATCRFLFVGRISPEKNIETLLKAFFYLHKQMPFTQLELIGKIEDGAYYEHLLKTIHEHDMESAVHFCGPKSSDHLAEHMSRSQVLVLPSRYEAFGLVIAEAMSMGLPVIASRVGGIPYLVQDGETGLLFDPNDHLQLQDHMSRLAQDAALRRAMGSRGRIHARSCFSADIVAQKMIAAYQEVLKSGRVFSERRNALYAIA